LRRNSAAIAPGRSPRATPPRPDPTAWRVVDGKLYLNYSHNIQRRWEQDVPGNIAKGDANWPKVLD
jgi:hypothetical protein